MTHIDIVFAKTTDPNPDFRFVEVEDANGAPVDVGNWLQRADGYWVLRVPMGDAASELASMTRMFHAACADLGAINEALGLDPDDGGALPILEAINDLKRWHQAVLNACMVRESCYAEDDPAKSIEQLLSWEVALAKDKR
jgi:hypothetical protein